MLLLSAVVVPSANAFAGLGELDSALPLGMIRFQGRLGNSPMNRPASSHLPLLTLVEERAGERRLPSPIRLLEVLPNHVPSRPASKNLS
jgi:hypothetical protein